jgi:peptidoglycan/xylan/chitin deacetylase (PgdA/CDA1 family)
MKRHLVTLSFDDGFSKSFASIAKIHEEFGLRACLNIISSGCEKGFSSPDEYHDVPTGSWKLWNELAARGHEVMPHSFDHANHAKLPPAAARRQVDACLEDFSANLEGFDPARAVYNFPYNASTPEIEKYVQERVRACRAGGGPLNPWPGRNTKRLSTGGFGPGNCEEHLDAQIERLLGQERSWLVYNLHGLDKEGWGPISTAYLRRLLERLGKIESVEILPAGVALAQYG